MPNRWGSETQGRLSATSGVTTGDSGSRWGGSVSDSDTEEPTTLGRLGRAASLATSGREDIKYLTGYDINNLPGYLSTPIDILANPVGIASLLAAIPTGGMSLGAAALGSTARAVGTRAAVDVASGIVGGKLGQLGAEAAADMGAPDWLQAGVGLGAGVVGGGVTGSVLSKRVGKGLKPTKTVDGKEHGKSFSPVKDDPFILEHTPPGTSVASNVANFFKKATGMGVESNPQATSILDDATATEKALLQQTNQLKNEMVAAVAKRDDVEYRAHGKGKATMIKVRVPDYGNAQEISYEIKQLEDQLKNVIRPKLEDAYVNGMAGDHHLFQALLKDPNAPELSSYSLEDASNPVRGVVDEYTSLTTAQETVLKRIEQLKLEEAAAIKNAPTSGFTWEPLADVAKHTDQYDLTPSQLSFIKPISDELTRYERMYKRLGGRLPDEGLPQGTYRVPRGKAAIEDMPGPTPAASLKTLKRAPSLKAAVDTYETVKEGLDAGLIYPPLEDAVHDYALEIGRSVIGRDAAKRFTNLGTVINNADGTRTFEPVLKTTDQLISEPTRKALTSAQSAAYGLDNKITELSQTVQERRATITKLREQERAALANEQQMLTSDKEGNLVRDQAMRETRFGMQKQIAELERTNQADIKVLEQLDIDRDMAGTVLASANEAYNAELAAVTRDPFLGSVDSASFDAPYRQSGENLYGPRAVTDVINSTLNPNGAVKQIADATKTISGGLRLFHTLMDISDFGRLAGTAGLMHPVDFFKGMKTGLKTMLPAFSKTALIDDFNSINANLAANGIPYGIKDFIKYGKLAMGSPDVDLGILKGLPGEEFISRTSNITQNGISSIRAHMVASELIKLKGAGEAINPAAIEKVVRGVSLTTGSSIHRGVKGTELFVQFPNWLQSQFEYIAHAGAGLKPGASYESKYAANSMIRMIGLGLFATYSINALGGKDTEIRNGVPMMRIGNNTIDAFGPYGALVRGFVAAAEGNLEPLIRSRAAPLFQIGWDLGSGETYSGDIASFDDPTYWAKIASPYSVTSLLDPDVDGEVKLLQGAGVRASSVPAYKLLREQAKTVMGMDWQDLSGKQIEDLKRANPELVSLLQKQTEERAAKGDNYAQGALASQKVTNEFLEQQATLNTLYESGQLSPVQLRDQLGQLAQVAAGKKEQIRTDFKLDTATGTPSKVTNALNQYFDLFNKADRGILSNGAKTGVLDWDVFDKLEADLMRKLDPIQQKAISDRYTKHDPALDWYYQNKQVIANSGYFEANQEIVNKLLPAIRVVVPDAASYSDIQEAYNKANRDGNLAQVIRLNALITRINAQTATLHRVLTLKNPSLYKALVENGYLKQSLSRPLAANIE